jgi:hypothetical protein
MITELETAASELRRAVLTDAKELVAAWAEFCQALGMHGRLVDRVTDDGEIEAAKDAPPQTTRAKLRGDFIAAAQAAGRDFTVDSVHLKLNDQAHRAALCTDPFRAVDERASGRSA